MYGRINYEELGMKRANEAINRLYEAKEKRKFSLERLRQLVWERYPALHMADDYEQQSHVLEAINILENEEINKKHMITREKERQRKLREQEQARIDRELAEYERLKRDFKEVPIESIRECRRCIYCQHYIMPFSMNDIHAELDKPNPREHKEYMYHIVRSKGTGKLKGMCVPKFSNVIQTATDKRFRFTIDVPENSLCSLFELEGRLERYKKLYEEYGDEDESDN